MLNIGNIFNRDNNSENFKFDFATTKGIFGIASGEEDLSGLTPMNKGIQMLMEAKQFLESPQLKEIMFCPSELLGTIFALHTVITKAAAVATNFLFNPANYEKESKEQLRKELSRDMFSKTLLEDSETLKKKLEAISNHFFMICETIEKSHVLAEMPMNDKDREIYTKQFEGRVMSYLEKYSHTASTNGVIIATKVADHSQLSTRKITTKKTSPDYPMHENAVKYKKYFKVLAQHVQMNGHIGIEILSQN